MNNGRLSDKDSTKNERWKINNKRLFSFWGEAIMRNFKNTGNIAPIPLSHPSLFLSLLLSAISESPREGVKCEDRTPAVRLSFKGLLDYKPILHIS